MIKDKLESWAYEYQATILFEDGLHRRLRLANQVCSWDRIDVMTWPRHLCVTGPVANHVFCFAEDDVLNEIRHLIYNEDVLVNADYWSNLAVSEGIRTPQKCFSNDLFRETIRKLLAEQGATELTRSLAEHDLLETTYDCAGEVEEKIEEFDRNFDTRLHEVFDYELKEYTSFFLITIYAIKSCADLYYKVKAEAAKS